MPGVSLHTSDHLSVPVMSAAILLPGFTGKCWPCSVQVYNSDKNQLLELGSLVCQVQLILALRGHVSRAYFKAFLVYILVAPAVTGRNRKVDSSLRDVLWWNPQVLS